MPIILRPPGERDSLPERLESLGRVRRRVAVAAGVFTLVALTVALAVIVGALDAWLHLGRLARGFALVGILTACGVVWLRMIAAPMKLRTDPLAVALELEARHPVLNDALASAVSFLESGPTPGAGRRLRETAIRTAELAAEECHLEGIVPSGRCIRSAWLCVLVLGAALPLALWNTARAETAIIRLADPFGAHPWPPKTRITIIAPQTFPARLPEGQPFVLHFTVRGEVPDRAIVNFRLADGTEFVEEYPLLVIDPSAPPPGSNPPGNTPPPSRSRADQLAEVVTQIDPLRLTGDFRFRIRANDADTGWLEVSVLPRPKLQSLSPQIRVYPPAYTGLAPVDLQDGTTELQIPAGSRIVLRATANVPLHHAVITPPGPRLEPESATAIGTDLLHGLIAHQFPGAARRLADEVGADIPVALTDDDRVMTAAFRPGASGVYVLKMTDRTDPAIVGPRELQITLTPDPAPEVTLHHPLAGRDPPLLVPSAQLRVSITAEDRTYGLRGAFIEYRVGRMGPVRAILLGDPDRSGAAAAAGGLAILTPPVADVRPPVRQSPSAARIDHAFALPVAAFRREDGGPVREGDVVFLRAAADDWDDVTVLKEPGRSTDRGRLTPGEFELRIVSPEAAEAYVQKELAALRVPLMRLRNEQIETRRQVEVVQAVAGNPGGLGVADREKILAAEAAQRQIRGAVADDIGGLAARAESLWATAAANGLLRPGSRGGLAGRVGDVAQGLRRLAKEKLPPIEDALGAARKGPEPGTSGPNAETAWHLGRAVRSQQAVEAGLADVLNMLAFWSGPRELLGAAQLLRADVAQEAATIDRLPDVAPLGSYPDQLAGDPPAVMTDSCRRLDQFAERADRLLLSARRIAAERTEDANRLRREADARISEAAVQRAQLNAYPAGSPEQRRVLIQADALSAKADELRAAAAAAATEAEMTRRAIRMSGDLGLVEMLRGAAADLEQNRQGLTLKALRADPKEEALAANPFVVRHLFGAGLILPPRPIPRDANRPVLVRLDDFIAALVEPPPDAVPQLAKPWNQWKAAADQLDALAAAQRAIRERAAAAAGLSDPAARAAAFRDLAAEQASLIDRGNAILQRLTRENPDAAREVRRAIEQMNTARDELEQGRVPQAASREARKELFDARDRLDREAQAGPQQASEDRRKRLFDRLQALLARQRAEAVRAARIHDAILAARQVQWPEAARRGYADLEDEQTKLAAEVRALASQEFGTLPVFEYLLTDAAETMGRVAKRAALRRDDANNADPGVAFDPDFERTANAAVQRSLELATRRLEYVLDAIKPGAAPPAAAAPGTEPPEAIPPLTQVQALRSLQAELNLRTALFDHERLHDPDAVSPDERTEIAAAERKVAELFRALAGLFQEPPADKPKEMP